MTQNVDSFTAHALLGALANGMSNDQGADLYKSLTKNDPTGAEVDDAVKDAMAKFKVGDPVKVDHTSYTGKVEGFNHSRGGFYPGSRYPIYVRIDAKYFENKQEHVFEYELDQVLPNPEQ